MTQEWLIHHTSTSGSTGWTRFVGTKEEAEAEARSYIGKVASWNATKEPHQPNLDDTYDSAWVEPVRETEILTDDE